MGTKRIGLARMEALLENLKREINLSGSTVCAQLGACQGTFGAPPLVIDDDSTVAAGTDEAVMIHQYSDGLMAYASMFRMLVLKRSLFQPPPPLV